MSADERPTLWVQAADNRGKFHYRCEEGHNTVASESFMDFCPAPVHDDGRMGIHVGQGQPDYAGCAECHPCGAETMERLVDYVPGSEAIPTGVERVIRDDEEPHA